MRRAHRAGARPAAPLRHALEPAAAAHQLRLQQVAPGQSGLLRAGALRRPALARRDRDLPATRGGGARHRRRRAVGADRERAGVRRCADRRRRARGAVSAEDRRRARRSCSTPERSRPTRGSICCLPRCGPCSRSGPTRGSSSPAGSPIRSRRRARQAAAAGIAAAAIFAGQRPAEEIPAFLDAADVLVSPRSLGTNTPLKIYQYLRSGRPIVATRLLTHTQVLDDEVSFLTEATAEGFGAGILAALADPERARAVGARARHLAETKYSYEAYLARTRQACAHLFGDDPAPNRSRAGSDRVRAGSDRGQTGADPARLPTTTATRSTPIRRWRSASTRCASAGRSAG